MRQTTLISILIVSVMATGCLNRNKQETTDQQCLRLVKKAEELQTQLAKTREKIVADQVANLITAAKIDQEHKNFPQCVDKSTRAIKLLDENAQLSLDNPR